MSEKETIRIMRVRVYKQTLRKGLSKEDFGKFKDRFVGEIGGDDGPKRLFRNDPKSVGRLLALNVRNLPVDRIVLVDEVDGLERQRREDGHLTAFEMIAPLEPDELQGIRMSMMGELGSKKVA